MDPLIKAIRGTRITGRLDPDTVHILAARGIPIVQLLADLHHSGDITATRAALSRGEVTDTHMQDALDIALARAFN